MPTVPLIQGETEVGTQNTQIGVFPVNVANNYLKQINTLNYRSSTLLVHREPITAYNKIQFYVSDIRNWLVLIIESDTSIVLQIINLSTGQKILDTTALTGLRNESLIRINFKEFSISDIGAFVNTENKFVGNSAIYICGFNELFYIDDDLTIKYFQATLSSTIKSTLEDVADIEIFQRRFVVITTTISSATAQTNKLGTLKIGTRNIQLGAQHTLLSEVDVFDNFTLSTTPTSTDGFALIFYLDPDEVMYSLKGILDAIYITTSSGLRQLQAVDRTQDILASTNAIQEIIGYAESNGGKPEFYSGAIIYATKEGLRYKLPNATWQPDVQDMGEAALTILTSLEDKVVTIAHAKQNHQLLVLLANGKIKALCEGTQMGGGLKSFPIYSYVDTENFAVVDVRSEGNIYYLVLDLNNSLVLLKEEEGLIPLCDGVSTIQLTETIQSATDLTITFPSDSKIGLYNPRDIWVLHPTISGWINMYQMEFGYPIYHSNPTDVSFAGLEGRSIQYFPTTDDIRPYLPIGYEEFQMMTPSIREVPNIDDTTDWFYRGLRITATDYLKIYYLKPNHWVRSFNFTPATYVFSAFISVPKLAASKLSISTNFYARGKFKPENKFTEYRTIHFGFGTGTGEERFKVVSNTVDVGCCNHDRKKFSHAINLRANGSNTELPAPDDNQFVWVYAIQYMNVLGSNTVPPEEFHGVWFNGIKQDVDWVYSTQSKGAIGYGDENSIQLLQVGGANQIPGGVTFHVGSIFLHKGGTTDLGFDIYDIEAAKAFFCTSNSGNYYWRPKKLTTIASMIHMQDDYNGLKNQAENAIFSVEGAGKVRSFNLKYAFAPEENDEL